MDMWKNGIAGYGAVLIHDNDNYTYQGRVYGMMDGMSSFRAEVGGVASMVTENQIILKQYFCDNESLIKILNQDTQLHPLSP